MVLIVQQRGRAECTVSGSKVATVNAVTWYFTGFYCLFKPQCWRN